MKKILGFLFTRIHFHKPMTNLWEKQRNEFKALPLWKRIAHKEFWE